MSGFASNIASLARGGIFAQMVSLAAMPLITRLYSTHDYGVFAAVSSAVLIVGPIATLRFNSALLVVSSETRAGYLFGLSLLASVVVSIVTLLVVALLTTVNDHLGIGGWIFVIPLAVLLVGLMQSLQSLTLRRKRFGAAAFGQICESLVDRGCALTSAYVVGSTIGGLLFGRALGLAGNCIWLLASLKGTAVFNVWARNFRIRLLQRIAVRYRRFPLVSSWAFIANGAARESPTLLLAAVFGVVPAGFYALGLRVLNVPLLAIGDSVAKVTLSRVREIRAESDRLQKLMLELFGLVFYLVGPVVVIMLFHGESLFALVFGETWREAGMYAAVLAPSVLLMLAYRVVSSLFDLFEKQGARCVTDLMLLASRVLAIMVGGFWFGWEIIPVLVFMLIAVSVVYVRALGYLFRLIGVSGLDIGKRLARLVLFSLPVAIVSILLHLLDFEGFLLLTWLVMAVLVQYLLIGLFDREFKISAI